MGIAEDLCSKNGVLCDVVQGEVTIPSHLHFDSTKEHVIVEGHRDTDLLHGRLSKDVAYTLPLELCAGEKANSKALRTYIKYKCGHHERLRRDMGDRSMTLGRRAGSSGGSIAASSPSSCSLSSVDGSSGPVDVIFPDVATAQQVLQALRMQADVTALADKPADAPATFAPAFGGGEPHPPSSPAHHPGSSTDVSKSGSVVSVNGYSSGYGSSIRALPLELQELRKGFFISERYINAIGVASMRPRVLALRLGMPAASAGRMPPSPTLAIISGGSGGSGGGSGGSGAGGFVDVLAPSKSSQHRSGEHNERSADTLVLDDAFTESDSLFERVLAPKRGGKVAFKCRHLLAAVAGDTERTELREKGGGGGGLLSSLFHSSKAAGSVGGGASPEEAARGLTLTFRVSGTVGESSPEVDLFLTASSSEARDRLLIALDMLVMAARDSRERSRSDCLDASHCGTGERGVEFRSSEASAMAQQMLA